MYSVTVPCPGVSSQSPPATVLLPSIPDLRDAAAAPAAIGAFSENEKNFGKSLIFVALGEGVAIYGLLISILIINKI